MTVRLTTGGDDESCLGSAGVDIHAAAIRLQAALGGLARRFNIEVFGDAALMILLDLFIAERDKRRLSIKSVCIGSGVPHSTALRYIERLETAGLIRRHANPGDRRSAYVALTPPAEEALGSVLTGLFTGRLA